MNIQQQIAANRQILRQLPINANFAYVWQPETLSHQMAVIFEARNTGIDVQNPEVHG